MEVSIGLIRALVKVKDSAKFCTVNRKYHLAWQHGWTHSNSGGKGLKGFMIIPALQPVLSRILLMPILLGYGSMSSIAIAQTETALAASQRPSDQIGFSAAVVEYDSNTEIVTAKGEVIATR